LKGPVPLWHVPLFLETPRFISQSAPHRACTLFPVRAELYFFSFPQSCGGDILQFPRQTNNPLQPLFYVRRLPFFSFGSSISTAFLTRHWVPVTIWFSSRGGRMRPGFWHSSLIAVMGVIFDLATTFTLSSAPPPRVDEVFFHKPVAIPL